MLSQVLCNEENYSMSCMSWSVVFLLWEYKKSRFLNNAESLNLVHTPFKGVIPVLIDSFLFVISKSLQSLKNKRLIKHRSGGNWQSILEFTAAHLHQDGDEEYFLPCSDVNFRKGGHPVKWGCNGEDPLGARSVSVRSYPLHILRNCRLWVLSSRKFIKVTNDTGAWGAEASAASSSSLPGAGWSCNSTWTSLPWT